MSRHTSDTAAVLAERVAHAARESQAVRAVAWVYQVAMVVRAPCSSGSTCSPERHSRTRVVSPHSFADSKSRCRRMGHTDLALRCMRTNTRAQGCSLLEWRQDQGCR